MTFPPTTWFRLACRKESVLSTCQRVWCLLFQSIFVHATAAGLIHSPAQLHARGLQDAPDEAPPHRLHAAREHLHAAQPPHLLAPPRRAGHRLPRPARRSSVGAGPVRLRRRDGPRRRVDGAALGPADRRRHRHRPHGRQGAHDRADRVPGRQGDAAA